MKLYARLMLVITIVVSVTDLVFFYHMLQRPEHFTLTYMLLLIFITILPMGIIFGYWHKKKWL